VLAVTTWSHDFGSWFALLMFSLPAGPANRVRVKLVADFTEIQHFNEGIIISHGCFLKKILICWNWKWLVTFLAMSSLTKLCIRIGL